MKLMPISPGSGDLMTINEFIESVKSGNLTDYDGMGDYATSTHYFQQEGWPTINPWVYPSDVGTPRFNPPKGCTHILWYNK